MEMSREEIRELVRNTMREEFRNIRGELRRDRELAFKNFGMSEEDEKEWREDQRYLRRWRKGADRITGLSLTALVTVIVGGFASALWLGIKSLVVK